MGAHLAPLVRVAGQTRSGCGPFGAQVVKALSDDPQEGNHPGGVAAATRRGALFSGEVGGQEADQALALHLGSHLGFVQGPGTDPAVGLVVSLLDGEQVLAAFAFGHAVIGGHGSLGITIL
jgi:hypothetical protein